MLRAHCHRACLIQASAAARAQVCHGPKWRIQTLCTSQQRLKERRVPAHVRRALRKQKRLQSSKKKSGKLISKDGSVKGEKSGVWISLRNFMESSRQEAKDGVTHKENDQEDDTESLASKTAASAEDMPSKRTAVIKAKRKGEVELEVTTVRPARLELKPIEGLSAQQVPQLGYDLDKVLFNPGVYQMQDQRSGVFNFDPYLASIMPVEEFDFDVLREYVTSSKDAKLRKLCAQHGKKYCGSTSSMTSILSQFHFLLSAWRPPNFENLSKSLKPESLNFTKLSRGPAAAFAHFKDGVYAIDADKEFDTENVLSMLGKSMEKLLTLPKEDFEKYRRSRSHQLSEKEKNAEEAYHFTTLGDFLMRSQLDAYDPRLPGSGVFDLKTRAVISIRMDVNGYEKGVGYEIRKRFGQWESFEREYYDMIRAAFLKYSLQVRIGRMDGIFVAFHNTQRIFGFQYISLAEMDQAIHGTNDTRLGDEEFRCSVALLNDLMDRATQRFPGRTLRLHVETRPTKVPLTYFFVEPVTEEEMRMTQESSKPSLEQLKHKIQGLSREEQEAETTREAEAAEDAERRDLAKDESSMDDASNEAIWQEMMSRVDDAVENESHGVRSIREAMQEALEQSGLLHDKTELESEKYVDDLVSALTAHSSEAKEIREQRSIEDNDGESKESTMSEVGSDDTTLANLILRVTESINEKKQNLRPFERKVADLAAQTKKTGSSSSDETTVARTDDKDSPDDPHAQGSAGEEAEGEPVPADEPKGELLGMYISIRNRVDGQFVVRPDGAERSFDWDVQYTITELSDKRARNIYSKIKKRRKDVLATDPEDRSEVWHHVFKGKLPFVTKEGEKFRQERTQQEAGSPVYVAWDRAPHPRDSFTEAGN